MKYKSEVLYAVKKCAKDIGGPDAIICDAASDQQLKYLQNLLGKVGTTLRFLEEGTPWANKADLNIGLIKEAVQKDTKEYNHPLTFGYYCVDQ